MDRFDYKPKHITFLQRWWNVHNGVRLAQLIGVPYTNLKGTVGRLRTKGYKFKKHKAEIGEVRISHDKNGRTYSRVRTPEGFKHIKVEVKKSSGRKPKEKVAQTRRKQAAEGKRTGPSGIGARSARQQAKQPVSKPSGKTKVYDTSRNPEGWTKKDDAWKLANGWAYVQTDKRTRKLLPPEKLAL